MTCSYSSPELLSLRGHSLPSDIWGLAATVYFVISKKEVIRSGDLASMAQRALKLRLSFDGDVWERYPASLKSLLTEMMRAEPENRLTIEKCLGHQFFQEMLGKEWIQTENDNVKIATGSKLTAELVRVKEAFADHRSC
jgi:serine/threonine protein kinase